MQMQKSLAILILHLFKVADTMYAQAMTVNKRPVYYLINFVLFQCVWFITVFGAAQQNLWYGLAAISIFVIVHLSFSATARIDFQLTTIAILLGMIIETTILHAGLLNYSQSIPSTITASEFAPIWVLILWANLALTLNGCMRWLQGRYLLAAILGATAAPLSYLGGIKLGAATASTSILIVIAAIALIYAFITPLLLYITKQLSEVYNHG